MWCSLPPHLLLFLVISLSPSSSSYFIDSFEKNLVTWRRLSLIFWILLFFFFNTHHHHNLPSLPLSAYFIDSFLRKQHGVSHSFFGFRFSELYRIIRSHTHCIERERENECSKYYFIKNDLSCTYASFDDNSILSSVHRRDTSRYVSKIVSRTWFFHFSSSLSLSLSTYLSV